jgi:hypothetical protein
MRQRLYRGHAYECDESQVDRAKFIAMALEIGPEESMGFAIEGFYILKPSRARNLLCKDAMQLGVDAMRLDRDGNKPAHRFLDRLRGDLRERSTDDPHDFLIMTIDDGGDERLFARVILLALSKPSLTRMRAVASISASTVARDRSCEAFFLGVVGGLRAMSCVPNASRKYELSLALYSGPRGLDRCRE